MKKQLLLLASAALVLAACTDNIIIDETKKTETAIGFSTYTELATKAENSNAENSNAENKNNLETHHQSFMVWGNKYINTDNTLVFDEQVVNWDTQADPDAWTYSPIRFWDKSASHYDFYAAAPAMEGWQFNNDTKELSLADFAVDGASLGVATEVSSNATMPNGKDLMISTNKTVQNSNFNGDKVNLEFNHILSRLNIGVKKADVLTDFYVKLKSLKVHNMKSNGSFNEGATLGDGVQLNQGTIARWLDATTPAKFTGGVGYASDGLAISKDNFSYVYQALVIPQNVAFANNVALNGVGLDNTSAPYLVIEYDICQNDAAHTLIDSYKYYYNLCAAFGGTGTTAINFCEGWQNTLKITISPVAINFSADVFEWSTKETNEPTID